ncbi:MAG: Patatin-like phospholipase [Deltaproteobacteria bacterium ADurb.Bin510]|nr:MAG: Patatin-like phospholipase [Deltaproteobacteria bacterium ADurb.Bin510]
MSPNNNRPRLLCYASGGLRGAYYVGVSLALEDAGIEFKDFAGVSAGANAATCHAAGQARLAQAVWDELAEYRLALHLEAIRTRDVRVHVAVSRVKPVCSWARGVYERQILSFDKGFTDEEMITAIRASSYLPVVNGLFSACRIGEHYYRDGGFTGRLPLDCRPLEEFGEVWCAVASPNGLAELEAFNTLMYPDTRFYFIVPSRPTPVGRMEIDKFKFRATAELGYADTLRVIDSYRQA